MYNHFTAVDQKPLSMGKVLLNPMQIPKHNKRRKKKPHTKNPYKIKKVKLLGQQAMAQKNVDGLMLLKMLHFEHPKQIITANISYKRIMHINSDHLQYFSNLTELNCSENYIPLEQLYKLPAVQKIDISHNQIRQLNLEAGGFNCLQVLNMSFNYLQSIYIPQLTLIPCLMDLDLSYNQLQDVPTDLANFTLLRKFNLQGNKFKSDQKASSFWAALATLPRLQILSISRNKIRGIHTQKLVVGNFSNLLEIDFSYNAVQNQHNLICARNFSSLKKLYITGNPFAINNQYKGLEMEVYARTGAEVIVENTNPYYLQKQKVKKPPIKFQRLVKIQPDDLFKKKNNLFGIELPVDNDGFTSSSESEIEQQSQQSEVEEPMFVTQQKQLKQKSSKSKAKNKSQKQNSNLTPDISVQGQELSQIEVINQPQAPSQDEFSLKSSSNSKSIEYGEFHKVAAQLLGGQKQYKKGFDIHTSYKALKKAIERVNQDVLP